MTQKSFNPKQRFSTFGKTTLKKINKLRIYIEGLSKIGADLTTNLILLNPQLIHIYDSQTIQLEDCYNTFHYPKQQANKNLRSDCLIEICKKINKKVNVKKLQQQLQDEQAHKYDLLIFCDMYDVDRVIRINNLLRQNKQNQTGIIFAAQMGFYGYIYTDYGDGFKLLNTGKHLPVILIDHITNEQQGLVTVNKEFKHGFKHGDFVKIDNVQGMKEINGDARPVKIVDDYKFLIEDTKHYGKYLKGGIAQKVKMTQKISFQSIETQILNPQFKKDENTNFNEQFALITKSILSFYQNNNKIPGLFNQANQNQVYENALILNDKKRQLKENKLRSIFRSCSYGFYPLIHLMSAIISLQCVKKTGKYMPIKTPYFINWYDKISFQQKKKIQNQYYNIIETDILEKLMKLQVGIIDDGAQTLELFNLLFSCQIAENRKFVLFGLETLEQKEVQEPLINKAIIKFNISRDLFKSRKMESLPCSLSFSNDVMLNQAWKRIKILLNASQVVNEYIYQNLIFNQVDLIDCQFSDLKAVLRMCINNKSKLRQSIDLNSQDVSLPNQFRSAVESSVNTFNSIFIDIIEDIRCFIVCGAGYLEKINKSQNYRKIFFNFLICLQSGGFISPDNIVKICKLIFTIYFQDQIKQIIASNPKSNWSGYQKKPILIDLDWKDQLVQEFLTSAYNLINWFFSKEKYDNKKIVNLFTQYLYKPDEYGEINDKERQKIALSKIQILSKIIIPYTSLLQLYKNEYPIQFIWNMSRIRSKIFSIEQEITSKKFFKFYNRKTKPCPFVHQIITSFIPLSIIQSFYNKINNIEVNVIENKIKQIEAQLPIKIKEVNYINIPKNSNEWTIITINGPKKIEDIIDLFNCNEGVTIQKIRCDTKILYSNSVKQWLSKTVEEVMAEKRKDFELVIDAFDSKSKLKCKISRTRYILQ